VTAKAKQMAPIQQMEPLLRVLPRKAKATARNENKEVANSDSVFAKLWASPELDALTRPQPSHHLKSKPEWKERLGYMSSGVGSLFVLKKF